MAEITEKFPSVERHAQTAFVLLTVALLIWVGQTTQRTAVAVAEMRVEVAFLKTAVLIPPPSITELSKRLDDAQQRLNILERTVLNEE